MGESRQTRAGVAIGTPSYMAPEQLRGEDVDGRTDLYAAGALLFELLTGRVAFEADSDYALMMQQLNEPPAPPGSIVAGVPRALDAAVACAMAKKPAQRFASATDFSRTLDEIAANSGSADPIRGAAASVAAKAPRDWRVYVIAGCVVVAGGLGVAALRSRTPSTDPVAISAVDSARIADSVASVARAAGQLPTIAEPSRPVGPTIASGSGPQGTEIGSGPVPAPVYTAPLQPEVATPPSVVRSRPPARSGTPPASPVRSPVTTPRTPARVVPTSPPVVVATTPPRVVDGPRPAEPPVRDETPPRETEPSAGAGSRRVQDLAERCVASIANNSGATAARLLRGDASGIIAAVNDGRIVSASGGNVAVEMGDGRGEGQFQVRIAWRTAFGGNKSGTARLTAEVSRTDAGWNTLGCRVENGGGVR
jgi:serine/threonine protein kinase